MPEHYVVGAGIEDRSIHMQARRLTQIVDIVVLRNDVVSKLQAML
jgi:hypothetical protein